MLPVLGPSASNGRIEQGPCSRGEGVNTYEEWRDFLKARGAIALMPWDALDKPCPKCGQHKGYQVTRDGYAYCRACSWGTATDYPFTGELLLELGPDGKPDRSEERR